MRHGRSLLVLAASLLACAALPSRRGAAQDGSAEVPGRAARVLQRHCARCHGGGASEGGLDHLDPVRLAETGLIAPGKPEESQVYLLSHARRMPSDDETRLTDDEVADLKAWIEGGARPFRASAAPAKVPSAIELIRKDLLALPKEDRPFQRYFTLGHVVTGGLCEDEIASLRRGLSEIVSSLSWKKKITPPVAVSAERTVYRIDLRDQDWTQETWKKILARYPYGLLDASDAAKECARETACDLPWVRADWFVWAAARAPLYAEILKLPATAGELEKLLQVDPAARRAGFHGSGESDHNRVVERHATPNGAYWKSFDLSSSSGAHDVVAKPLGPGKGFQHDGGEILFSLPNGLQAYMIVRANGERAEKAPVENVWNKRATHGPIENVAAISCLSCHAGGPLDAKDEVRASVEKSEDEAFAGAVRALYAEKDELASLIREDRARQARALEAALAPATRGSSVLVALARRYEEPVSPRAAAAELGVDEGLLRGTLAGFRELMPLVRRKPVRRAAFARSFARVAAALKLGTCLAHQEPEPLLLEPPRPGLVRFESPAQDRVLSVEVDRTWAFETRKGGLVLSRGDNVKLRFAVEDNDATDTDDAIAREGGIRPRMRLLDHADDPEPSVERYFVERYAGKDGTTCVDWATLKGTRTKPMTGRLYRLSATVQGTLDQALELELRRTFKHARISRGADASPEDPFTTDLPEALAKAGFETSWEKALARAKAEGKLVLCFVKPCAFWFT